MDSFAGVQTFAKNAGYTRAGLDKFLSMVQSQCQSVVLTVLWQDLCTSHTNVTTKW